MLQDLEARKAQPDTSADYQASEPQRKFPWSLVFILLLLIGAGWYGYASYLQGVAQIKKDPSAAQNVAAAEKPAPTMPTDTNQTDHVEAIQSVPSQNQDAKSAANVEVTQNTRLSDADMAAAQLTEAQLTQNSIAPVAQSAQDETSQLTASTTKRDESELPQMVDTKAETPASNIAKAPMKVRSEASQELTGVVTASASEPNKQQFNVKSSSEAQTESDLRQQVQVALKRGDETTATELLTKLVQVSPENEKARKRLAAMLFSQGKRNQADTVLQQGIDLQPDNQELRLMQAKMHVQMKNPSKAHDLLVDYPVSAALSPDFVSYRAALAQQVERFSHAQQDYHELTLNQPANAKWWLGLAVAEERLGNNKEALTAYQNAKQLAQLSVEVDRFVEQRIHYLAGVN
ncbi:tetratricopeptide repeat protein [Aliiglaciecola litoralis]|uniref:Tetratricopeptide repeat protein n=2 Tax=Aliiglaciecola litoralis TaxID=582857 RepID=A0ABP3WTK1_9ALTE